MIVRFLQKARTDLSATLQHIAKDNPTAAQELAERVLTVVERLAAGEFDGPERQLTSGRAVRSWPVPPLRIYYRRTADALVVLRIYHHARRPIMK